MKRILSFFFALTLATSVSAQSFNDARKADALKAYAAVANIEIVLPTDVPLQGTFHGNVAGLSPQEALTQILGPTWTFEVREGKFYIRARRATDPGYPYWPGSAAMRQRHSEAGQSPYDQRYGAGYGQQYGPMTGGMQHNPNGEVRHGGNYTPILGDRLARAGWGATVVTGYNAGTIIGNPNVFYGNRGNRFGGVGGYGYNYHPNSLRPWRKFSVEEHDGYFKIDSQFSEETLRLYTIYVNGCARAMGSKTDDWFNGGVGVMAGRYRVEIINRATGEGLGDDYIIIAKARSETARTNFATIHLHESVLQPNYVKMECSEPLSTRQ
jgi:hypothetical protein